MSQYEAARAALSYTLSARSFLLFLVSPPVYILIILTHLHLFLNYVQTNLGSFMAGVGWSMLISCEVV